VTTHTETPQSEKLQNRKKARRRTKGVDALALLKADHRAVEQLFAEYELANKLERKQELAQKICTELTVHAKLEESSFYPAVRQALPQEDALLNEAEVEHSSLKWLIAQLASERSDSEHFDAKVVVLKEYVQHHVKEEEKLMFPKIRKSTLDTRELGQVLQARKQRLQDEPIAH
jgi:hemerythrin superfamily protein